MSRSPSYDDPRFAAARELGGQQGHVLSRPQLYGLGITRWEIRGQVQSRRWTLLGDQSVCLHNGPVEPRGHWWGAVHQGGPRACLDGATALVAGGMERFTVDRVRVSVPRGAKVRRSSLYDIRQTRRWAATDRAPTGISRAGLPEPDRQVLRQDGRRRYYLDLYWDAFKIVVEIDGIHHAWAENVVGDALRQNTLAVAGDTVLRLPDAPPGRHQDGAGGCPVGMTSHGVTPPSAPGAPRRRWPPAGS